MKSKAKVTERPGLYDWLYGDFDEDIPLYLKLAEPYDTVLECGIGTGRIAIPLAEKGHSVYGIDNSPEMLEQLERNLSKYPPEVRDRIRIYEVDMRRFDLGRQFPLILVAFSTFNYLLTVEDQQAALEAMRKHVTPDGALVLEILSFSHYPAWFKDQPVRRKMKEKVHPVTGEIGEAWRIGSFDCTTQIVSENRYFRFYHAEDKSTTEELITWENRLFFIGEMRLLLEGASFEIAKVYGDWDFGPYRHDSSIAVVVAKPV